MEDAIDAIGAFVVGVFGWVFGNLAGALVYAVGCILLALLITAGVVAAQFIGNIGRRRRGEPIKPLRWR